MSTYDMRARWYAADKVRRLYGKQGFFQALHHRSEYTRGAAAHWLHGLLRSRCGGCADLSGYRR